MCQDTGTAIVIAKKGDLVWTDGTDQDSLCPKESTTLTKPII